MKKLILIFAVFICTNNTIGYAANTADHCVGLQGDKALSNNCSKAIYVKWYSPGSSNCSRSCLTSIRANGYSTVSKFNRVIFAACFQPERPLEWDPHNGANKYRCGLY